MIKHFVTTLFFIFLYVVTTAQAGSFSLYEKKTVMIPMRDGVKLFTVILAPVNASADEPILIQRTPYSANRSLPDDTVFNVSGNFQYANMEGDEYIFVFQDIRGKFKSEGTMQKRKNTFL